MMFTGRIDINNELSREYIFPGDYADGIVILQPRCVYTVGPDAAYEAVLSENGHLYVVPRPGHDSVIIKIVPLPGTDEPLEI
jgi:hypothetical protein